MTLKRKIAINVSIAFSILFGLIASLIYINFSAFRRDGFKERLEDKAQTTVKLITDGNGIDKRILKSIDLNNKLYNEKTLIFNSDFKLIYSSDDKTKIEWTKQDLENLKSQKKIYRVGNQNELLGIYFQFNQGDYYVLITAQDQYGYSKMTYLLYMTLVAFFISVVLVWITTYYFIKIQLNSLDVFQQKITSISANELNSHLEENNDNDEIKLLTVAFNQMLTRLENSFAIQKEFTSAASHELYTPLTRISLQLENLIQSEEHSDRSLNYLKSINNDVHQIADLINSLLILAKVNKEDISKNFKKVRIDEIIFHANDQVKKINSQFDLEFNIHMNDSVEEPMELNGIKSLLRIAFFNLLKNAYLYSSDKKARVVIEQMSSHEIKIVISNDGNIITEEEQGKIFSPFMRGTNSNQIIGSGLGLAIVKRIFDYHNVAISYNVTLENRNQFTITFAI